MMTDKVHQGIKAKEILESDVFIDAFEQLETEIIKQWSESPARDLEGREKLWQLLTIAKKFQTILQTTLETGKLASLELERQKTLLQRAKESVSW